MSRAIRPLVLLVSILAFAGCGGSERSAEESADGAPAAGSSGRLSEMLELPESSTAGQTGYVSEDDPDAVYTLEDIPDHGQYRQLDFSGLDPEVVNAVVHRLRTELCPCGCEGMTVDMCLYDDPNCGVARPQAELIIAEEIERAAAGD